MGNDAPGLISSLKRLLATLISIGKTRIELLSVEVEEEIEQLASLVFWGALSFFFLGIGILLVAIMIAVAFWESDRLLALGLLAAFFSVVGLATGMLFLKKTKERPRLFSQSLEELSKDLSELE